MTGTTRSDAAHDSRRFPVHFACLLFALTFTGLLLSPSFSLLKDGDTFWHISTGRWIVENMAIPRSDMFSHTFKGELWLAKEWLSQTALYAAYELGGWKAVNTFSLLVLSATIALLSGLCVKYFRFSIAIGVIVMAGVFASIHFLARPHLLAYPVMMIWVMGVVFAADRQRVPSFWLLPLMALWANMHGGFTLGLAIAGLMSLETLMATPRAELKPQVIRHGLFLFLATLACLATPFGIQSILITPKIFGLGEILDHIGEWKSPDFHKYEYHLVVLMGLLGSALYGGLRLPLMRTIAVLLLSYLMFKHVRAMPVFAFLMPILLAGPVSEQFGAVSLKQLLADNVADPVLEFFQRHSRRLPVIAVVIVGAGMALAITKDPLAREEGMTKPIAAVEFVQKHGLTGNVFNDYDFGGYLIFHRIPTFIDGRAELYGREFFNEYYSAAWRPKDDELIKLLDKHKISWTLVRPEAGSAVVLDQSPDWQCVYAEGISMIHVRVAAPEMAKVLESSKDTDCNRFSAK